jgi:hypothetical protein
VQRVALRVHLRLANALEAAVRGAIASIPGAQLTADEPVRDIPLPPSPVARMILFSLDFGHGPSDVLALVGSRAGMAALAEGAPEERPDDPRLRVPEGAIPVPAEILLRLPGLTEQALAALKPGARLVSAPGTLERATLAVAGRPLATGALQTDRAGAQFRVAALGVSPG